MQNNLLIATHLKRFNSAIYSVKELIEVHRVDGYDHLIDTLMVSYYGIEEIISEMEIKNREEMIKRAARNQK